MVTEDRILTYSLKFTEILDRHHDTYTHISAMLPRIITLRALIALRGDEIHT